MNRHVWTFGVVLLFTLIVVAVIGFPRGQANRSRDSDRGFGSVMPTGVDRMILRNAIEMLLEGQQTFRFDTLIGIDAFQANRGSDRRYRRSPLKGLWTHTQGGFYHDGRFATLPGVVGHDNAFFGLDLSEPEINDLVEYLKSL